ncbi:hypothetical protein EJ03DRAFT_337249 [Teratosphaeria nubilosa]|uniref:Uncharacterized protein n=1 Tax=Teratosphaeria nubilosa TaxID=161662 RepID=A0A6G1L557_9PEZI|nr:hypothetical protein EJ03DRAFT_337249 [Teratosphaeria nubilosa]
MRPSSVLVLASTATAFSLPNLQPFWDALPISLQDYIPTNIPNNTIVDDETHNLLKRSTSCPSGFNSCSNLGAANLCCASQAVCSADYAGNVACCPSGAACTGSISGIITAGTVSNGYVVGGARTATAVSASTSTSGTGTGTATTTTTTTGLATGSGFILSGSSTVATVGSGARRIGEVTYDEGTNATA